MAPTTPCPHSVISDERANIKKNVLFPMVSRFLGWSLGSCRRTLQHSSHQRSARRAPSTRKTANLDTIPQAHVPKDLDSSAEHLPEYLPTLGNPYIPLLLVVYVLALLPEGLAAASIAILHVLRLPVHTLVPLTMHTRVRATFDVTWAARLPKLPRRPPVPSASPSVALDLR